MGSMAVRYDRYLRWLRWLHDWTGDIKYTTYCKNNTSPPRLFNLFFIYLLLSKQSRQLLLKKNWTYLSLTTELICEKVNKTANCAWILVFGLLSSISCCRQHLNGQKEDSLRAHSMCHLSPGFLNQVSVCLHGVSWAEVCFFFLVFTLTFLFLAEIW